jgi:hypothetical protein
MGVTLAGPRRARKWAESAQGSGNYACILLVKLRRTRLKRPIFDEIIGLTSKTNSVHTCPAKLYILFDTTHYQNSGYEMRP